MTEGSKTYLPYGRQSIDERDIAAVTAVLRSDYLTTGPAVEAFEKALAARVQADYAVACSSGTAALHLAAMALGLGPGDAIVVPAVSFLASANAARYVGAEVVFADVDPASGLMTAESLEAAIARCRTEGRNLRAVHPVHLNGQAVDMLAVSEIARREDLKVVEDACHLLGGGYAPQGGDESAVGSCAFSDMTMFSFHPVKAIAMGEGGALTTNQAALNKRLIRLRNHGIVRDCEDFERPDLGLDGAGRANPWYYEMPEPGYNYRASDIHCALGLSQLDKLDRFTAAREALMQRYYEGLAPLAPLIRPVARVTGCRPAWHLCAVRIDFEALGLERAELMRRLNDQGIGTQVHYIPLHWQPYYRKRYGEVSLPGAEAYYRHALSLPLFPGMTAADVDRVVEALATLCKGRAPKLEGVAGS